MRAFGFSTGSLALGDFHCGLKMLQGVDITAVELSALREEELDPLLASLSSLDLTSFRHISIHAPSKLRNCDDTRLCQRLLKLRSKHEYPIVVHPDIIRNWDAWLELGDSVWIENMDKRKPVGRTSDELASIFEKLPQAKLCLDVGHSRQIDSSMFETRKILKNHKERLAEIHLSHVNSSCGHEPLNAAAVEAFRCVARFIPESVPVILESPVDRLAIPQEIRLARQIFENVLVTV